MKTFTKLSLLAAVLALVATPLVVQAARSLDAEGNPRHPRLRQLVQPRLAAQALARRLHLTSDQKVELREVRVQAREELRSIRADQNLTSTEKRAKARETLRSARLEARSKLQESQRLKLDKLRQRLRERRLT
jgi:hypothetical protein